MSGIPADITSGVTDFLINPSLDRARAYGADLQAVQSLAAASDAYRTIAEWPGYAPTPLVPLPSLAALTGIAQLQFKHEGHRFELMSFKALGGAYAAQLVARQSATAASGLTFTCATDGNHGRSVAWGARRLGAKSVIYVHETVSVGRAQAIARLGAEVRREGRTYDDAVRAADAAARTASS